MYSCSPCLTTFVFQVSFLYHHFIHHSSLSSSIFISPLYHPLCLSVRVIFHHHVHIPSHSFYHFCRYFIHPGWNPSLFFTYGAMNPAARSLSGKQKPGTRSDLDKEALQAILYRSPKLRTGCRIILWGILAGSEFMVAARSSATGATDSYGCFQKIMVPPNHPF